MADRLRISVVMTTYQGAAHLAEQLDSILAQQRTPDEVVVSDDASTDGTGALLEDYARRHPSIIRLRSNPSRLGLRLNMQAAIEQAQGDVLVLADQDDLWHPEKLVAVEQAFADPAVTLWFSDAELIDAQGRAIGHTAWEAVSLDAAHQQRLRDGSLERLLGAQTVTGATMAVRADVARVALPFPPELEGPGHLFLHDGWLAALAGAIGRVVVDPRRLTSYRQHDRQVTRMSLSRSGDHGEGKSTRRHRAEQLQLDRARVTLVADRVRTAGVDGVGATELFRREALLAVRALPRGAASRQRLIREQIARGNYHQYSSGFRAAISDLIAPLPKIF